MSECPCGCCVENYWTEEKLEAVVAALSPVQRAAMAEEAPPPTRQQLQEIWAATCLDGGKCIKSDHEPLTDYQCIYLLRQLRLRYPHLSTNPIDLERELNRLAKKLK